MRRGAALALVLAALLVVGGLAVASAVGGDHADDTPPRVPSTDTPTPGDSSTCNGTPTPPPTADDYAPNVSVSPSGFPD